MCGLCVDLDAITAGGWQEEQQEGGESQGHVEESLEESVQYQGNSFEGA